MIRIVLPFFRSEAAITGFGRDGRNRRTALLAEHRRPQLRLPGDVARLQRGETGRILRQARYQAGGIGNARRVGNQMLQKGLDTARKPLILHRTKTYCKSPRSTRTRAIAPMPRAIKTVCDRVARSSGRRCRPGIRSATAT